MLSLPTLLHTKDRPGWCSRVDSAWKWLPYRRPGQVQQQNDANKTHIYLAKNGTSSSWLILSLLFYRQSLAAIISIFNVYMLKINCLLFLWEWCIRSTVLTNMYYIELLIKTKQVYHKCNKIFKTRPSCCTSAM